jgi:DNA-binding CsgD family transcriptional regulator
MVRVRIIAGSRTREQAIADILAEDDRLLVVDSPAEPAEVVVVADSMTSRLPPEGNLVLLRDVQHPVYDNRARAWLPENVTADELVSAIMAAAHDLTVLTSEQARQSLPGRNHPASSRIADEVALEPLTNREQQVLRMLADGLGNKEIAGRLGISDHTAKFHVAQILAKLGAGSRTEAVTTAIRRGLVPI